MHGETARPRGRGLVSRLAWWAAGASREGGLPGWAAGRLHGEAGDERAGGQDGRPAAHGQAASRVPVAAAARSKAGGNGLAAAAHTTAGGVGVEGQGKTAEASEAHHPSTLKRAGSKDCDQVRRRPCHIPVSPHPVDGMPLEQRPSMAAACWSGEGGWVLPRGKYMAMRSTQGRH